MSSACTIVSPSQVSFGPGGDFVECCLARKFASVSAGVPPLCLAMPLSANLEKLKPEAAKSSRNVGGVSDAVDGHVREDVLDGPALTVGARVPLDLGEVLEVVCQRSALGGDGRPHL